MELLNLSQKFTKFVCFAKFHNSVNAATSGKEQRRRKKYMNLLTLRSNCTPLLCRLNAW